MWLLLLCPHFCKFALQLNKLFLAKSCMCLTLFNNLSAGTSCFLIMHQRCLKIFKNSLNFSGHNSCKLSEITELRENHVSVSLTCFSYKLFLLTMCTQKEVAEVTVKHRNRYPFPLAAALVLLNKNGSLCGAFLVG